MLRVDTAGNGDCDVCGDLQDRIKILEDAIRKHKKATLDVVGHGIVIDYALWHKVVHYA